MLLLRIQFYDELLLNIFRNTLPFRISNESTGHSSFIEIDPVEFWILTAHLAGKTTLLSRRRLKGNDISRFQLERRNIHYFTIYQDMLVAHQLTGSRTRRCNTQTIYSVVKTSFQKLDQVFTSNTLTTGSFFEGLAELLFQYTISVFCFLLFTELESVLTQALTLAGSTMLTGRIAVLVQPFSISQDGLTEDS